MTQLLEYEPASDVEDIFCRTFSYEYDLFGETKCVELIPDGKSIAVNGENRKRFVESFLQWCLVDSIHSQFNALFRGFTKVVNASSLLLLSPEELELLMVGTPHLNFTELERHAAYIGDENWGINCMAVKYFWSVLHEMELEDKQRFLRFATGSSKAPLGGLKNLGLKIQRMGPDSNQLPTSHTCFNTILIPEYSSREKTKDRLLKAITECEGFGLK